MSIQNTDYTKGAKKLAIQKRNPIPNNKTKQVITKILGDLHPNRRVKPH